LEYKGLKNGKKKLLYIVAILGLLFGVLWIEKNNTTPKKLSIPKDTKVSLEYNFPLNIISTYRLKFQQSSTLLLDKRVPLTQKFYLNALLHIKAIEKEKGLIWVLMQFSQLDLSKSSLSEIAKRELKKLYKKPFLVHFTDNGEILDIRFKGVAENYISLKQTIYLLEIVNQPYAYYETVETDTNGDYKAIYTKDDRSISKKIDFYYPDANLQDFIVLDNSFNALISKKSVWLKSLKVSQKLKNKKGEFENYNQIELSKIDTKIDKSLEIFSSKKSVKEFLSSFDKEMKTEANIWDEIKEIEDKKTIQKLNLSIEKIMQQISDTPKDTNNFLLLSKYLKANPKGVFELVDRFNEYDDYVQMQIIGIMEFVSTKEAEEALSQLAIDDDITQDNRVRAIVSIGSLKKPSATSVETITSIIDDNSNEESVNTASLALGTLSDKIEDDEISHKVKELFNSATSSAQKRVMLYSIQNAGVDNFVSEVKSELKSTTKRNRILALKTLNMMSDKQELEAILKEQKHLETDKTVLKVIDKLAGKE